MSRIKLGDTTIDVNGLTWKDVIELNPTHISGISQKSLAKLTSRLVSVYNKRVKRLENSGMAQFSPAYKGLVESGKTRLSVKGASQEQLFDVFRDAKRFLSERQTSTIKGTQKLIDDIADRLGYRFQDKTESHQFWEAYDKLKELQLIDTTKGKASKSAQVEIADLMFKKDNMSIDEILKHYGAIVDSKAPSARAQTDELMENEEGEEDGDGEPTRFN